MCDTDDDTVVVLMEDTFPELRERKTRRFRRATMPYFRPLVQVVVQSPAIGLEVR